MEEHTNKSEHQSINLNQDLNKEGELKQSENNIEEQPIVELNEVV